MNRPVNAALMRARCSSLYGPRLRPVFPADCFARHSGERGGRFLPSPDADIFAHVSGDSVLPRWALDNFARVSGERGKPSFDAAILSQPSLLGIVKPAIWLILKPHDLSAAR